MEFAAELAVTPVEPTPGPVNAEEIGLAPVPENALGIVLAPEPVNEPEMGLALEPEKPLGIGLEPEPWNA